jgi:hypothetical protein
MGYAGPEPFPIASGGTNASSMSTSSGIVKYNGTSLITSSTATIDSNNFSTNSAQPAFLAYRTTGTGGVTGDGTNVTVVFDTVVFDQNSNYNTSTGIFTAPKTGNYLFTSYIYATGWDGSTNTVNLNLIVNGTTMQLVYGLPKPDGNYGTLTVGGSGFVPLSATQQVTVQYMAGGDGTKTIGISGRAGFYETFFSGYLVC